MTEPVASGGAGQSGAGGTAAAVPPVGWPSALADAGALGIRMLAAVVAGAHEGVAIYDGEGFFVYANPAACEVLGMPLEQLRGRHILDCIADRSKAFALARYSRLRDRSPGDPSGQFAYVVSRPDGTEREVLPYSFLIDIAGSEHVVTIFRDVTAARSAARSGMALAQTTAQMAATEPADKILAGIARHAVAGTRAVACGILAVGDDHTVASRGGWGWGCGPGMAAGESGTAPWAALSGVPAEDVVEAMTSGSIRIGETPGMPVVLADARTRWEGSPILGAVAATLQDLGWQAGVYVPLAWENRVFGLFAVYLPAGLPGPSEVELAFYTALADQAAVAMTNARLASEARDAAAFVERTRLARELHDSVSQALFSMTMHARAAQLSMAGAGVAPDSPLGRSVAELAALTRGALAEMRALIFELRPGALAEEGLVSALAKQAAALTAREQAAITVQGPEQRLDLPAEAEEHLYRIASEALNNVARHARAERATVSVTSEAGVVRVAVSDDGVGFDPGLARPGHLGLSSMAERARFIGADLTITSAPGAGTTVAVSVQAGPPDQGRADLDAR